MECSLWGFGVITARPDHDARQVPMIASQLWHTPGICLQRFGLEKMIQHRRTMSRILSIHSRLLPRSSTISPSPNENQSIILTPQLQSYSPCSPGYRLPHHRLKAPPAPFTNLPQYPFLPFTFFSTITEAETHRGRERSTIQPLPGPQRMAAGTDTIAQKFAAKRFEIPAALTHLAGWTSSAYGGENEIVKR